MLLRRVIEHVKTQNWTAVALDFIIVVVGVFIGIQVANWNDARADNRKSREFTERLTSDLQNEAWNYQYLIEYYEDVLTSGHRALDALTGEAQLSDEALLINAYRATQYLSNVRSRSTFDELSSTGAFDLIRDENLLKTAIWVFNESAFEDIAITLDNTPYRKLFRMLVPLDIQVALLEQCGDRDVAIGDFKNIVDSLDYPCEIGIQPQRVSETAKILRSDVSVIPFLRLRLANAKTYSTNLTNYNMGSSESLRAIGRASR